jgi:DNA polymerase
VVDDSLDKVAAEVRACKNCPLHAGRTNAVPGDGSPRAQIMFIGEGPGFHEDRQGLPFVGAAGGFLNELLAGVGLKREDVYITNVVKCRPPGNRDPLPEEIAACQGYLDRQIELIDPKVIVTLGRYSMARWFPSARISHIHGKPRQFGRRLVVPFYHPAAALHQPSLRVDVINDFANLPQFVARMQQERGAEQAEEQPPDDDQLQQLSLF